MQDQVVQMINQWIEFKKMIFQGKGQGGQRDIDPVDRRLKLFADVIPVEGDNVGIFQKMKLVIPVRELVF
jgi:hypothetical protein